MAERMHNTNIKRQCAQFITICLICTASFVILANKIQLVRYQNLECGRELKHSIEEVIGNTFKNNSLEGISIRLQRTATGIENCSHNLNLTSGTGTSTSLEDIFISVKTNAANHRLRLDLLLKTWISFAKRQTYIFTDADDPYLNDNLDYGHVINTNCPKGHERKPLLCKMAQEFDWFISSEKRWFCHVDDDTYLNVQRLVSFLQQFNHSDDFYLGKPSLRHPVKIRNRAYRGQNMSFWFATGGAGFCISRALSLKMLPHAREGRLVRAGEQNRLSDDCIIGYIIECMLHKELTVIKLFHSHLEALWKLNLLNIKEQISFSYSLRKGGHNVVNIHGFPSEKDPTRFISIHCHLYPLSIICQNMTDT